MILRKVSIQGFRSIAGHTDLFVREHLTCLVGANEHGKTNILDAVSRLTARTLQAEDANSTSRAEGIPKLTYHLDLNDTELSHLVEMLQEEAASSRQKVERLETAEQGSSEELKKAKDQLRWEETALKRYTTGGHHGIVVKLFGLNGAQLDLGSFYWSITSSSKIESLIGVPLPQVRLFEPSDDLSDSITLPELQQRKNLPFEGLLKLAKVWDDKEALFAGDLIAHRMHIAAGKLLTRRLRALWTQGEAHTIRLTESAGRLRVSIEDPTTLDVPSSRSLGFRSFLSFALSLYAETDTLTPRGFILLFDEPGLHLHPQGQKDLLREIRRLAKKNQIIYSTHSPFLIDRNDPTSTVLVKKELRGKNRGTRIVQKPYGSNWKSVSSALGITPSDAFFPPEKVLIVEGTSDRLYVTRYMGLCATQTRADLNYLHLVDADRREEMYGTAKLYLAAGSALTILADADKGGDNFVKALKGLAKDKKRVDVINMRALSDAPAPFSIEDLLPIDDFVAALHDYVKHVLGFDGEISTQGLLRHKSGQTLGGAAAAYLEHIGALDSARQFSKTTVADFFCQRDLSVLKPDHPMARLCAEITRSLGIAD